MFLYVCAIFCKHPLYFNHRKNSNFVTQFFPAESATFYITVVSLPVMHFLKSNLLFISNILFAQSPSPIKDLWRVEKYQFRFQNHRRVSKKTLITPICPFFYTAKNCSAVKKKIDFVMSCCDFTHFFLLKQKKNYQFSPYTQPRSYLYIMEIFSL